MLTPVSLQRVFKRLLKGQDLVKLVFIGSSRTFLSEIGTLSFLFLGDWLGSAGQFSLGVSHVAIVKCGPGQEPPEGLAGLDVQTGSFTWLAVDTGCWLLVASPCALLSQHAAVLGRTFPRVSILRDPGINSKISYDLALEVTQCHFLCVFLVIGPVQIQGEDHTKVWIPKGSGSLGGREAFLETSIFLASFMWGNLACIWILTAEKHIFSWFPFLETTVGTFLVGW